MKILVLNWRCPKNSKSGGAEYVTLKHASFWAANGHEVTWYAGGQNGLSKEEYIDGVKIVRFLNPITCYLYAPIYYFVNHCKFDIVIDEIHGIPFLTPLWAFKSRKIAFIHEVAQEIWQEMFKWPLSFFGKLYEKIYFLLYKKTQFWTDCNSTAIDLVKFGISKKNILVAPCAVDLEPFTGTAAKDDKLITFFTISRLVPMKGIEEAIDFFTAFNAVNNASVLKIAGGGDEAYIKTLKALVSQKDLNAKVVFMGRITEEAKVDEIRKSHFFLNFSVREGFGLTVLEANSQKTPVIARQSPGLVDIVVNNVNGFIGKWPDDKNLIARVEAVLKNKHAYTNLCESSVKYSQSFNWDQILKKTYQDLIIQ